MSDIAWLITNGAFMQLLTLLREPSTAPASDLFSKRLKYREELFVRSGKLVAMIGKMPAVIDNGHATLQAIAERWKAAFPKKKTECSPERLDELHFALKELADPQSSYGDKNAIKLATKTPLPWLSEILLGRKLTKDDLKTRAAAHDLVRELDAVSSLCGGGGAPDRILGLWLARPFLAFRTVSGSDGTVDLPLLYAALGLAEEAKRSQSVAANNAADDDASAEAAASAAVDAGIAWKGNVLKGDAASVRRATSEEVQLAPEPLWPRERDDGKYLQMQAFVDLQSSWVHGFLSEAVFKTTSDEALADAMAKLLEIVRADQRIGFVRVDLGKKIGADPRVLQTGFEVAISPIAQDRPRDRQGFPLQAFTDSSGAVSFPAVFSHAAAAKGAAKITGLPVFAVAPRSDEGARIRVPGLQIRIRDARTADGVEVTGTHAEEEAVPKEWKHDLSVSFDEANGALLAKLSEQVLSQYEEAVNGLAWNGKPGDPPTLPVDAPPNVVRAWRAFIWPQAEIEFEPGAKGSMSLLLGKALGKTAAVSGRIDQYLPAHLYAADAAKALEGHSFRDMEHAAPPGSGGGEARQAWRALQELQPTRFRDELAKHGRGSSPMLPLRTGHWLRLRSELADLSVSVPVNGQATVKKAYQVAGSVLAAKGPQAIGHAFEKEQLRILGAVAYAFGDTVSVDEAAGSAGVGGMADVLSRFASAWVALDGVDAGYSANAGQAEDSVARVWEAWAAAGIESPQALAKLCSSDATRLAQPRLPVEFPLSVIREQYARACVGSVRTGNVKAEVVGHAMSSSVPALSAVSAAAPDQGESVSVATSSEPDLPDLRRLFGSLDVCACVEDESVYGAPAYLVDAMEFLRYRPSPDATYLSNYALKGTSGIAVAAAPPSFKGASAACCYPQPCNALEVLLERRPDLEHLDLNAANTTRDLPHIDLVNEIFEAALAGDPETLGDMVKVAWGRDLDEKAPVPQALLDSLRAEGIDVTPAARLSIVTLPKAELAVFPCRQVVLLRDAHAAVRFQRERRDGRWSISRNRNTTLSAASLAAEPEHVNESVYRDLERQAGGLSLPFSLSEARLDSYLALVDADRAQIDTDWQGEDDRDELTRTRRAGLALGLQLSQTQLIAQTDPAFNESDLWRRIAPEGYPLHQAKASEVLQGLELGEDDELEAWLRSVTLRSIGLEANWPKEGKHCDTSKILLRWPSGNEPFLLTRAIRLRRALEWTVTEIDQAICSPRIGAGKLDLACLEQIGALRRLLQRLKAPKESVISMFGRIAHEGYEKPEHSLYWRVFLDPVRTGDSVFSEPFAQFQPAQIRKLRIADVREPLALRLSIDAALLMALISERASGTAQKQESNPLLDDALLSELWGHVQLKGLLSLPWRDYFAALRMFRFDGLAASPFASPRVLNAFLDELDTARQSSSLSLANTCLLVTGRMPVVPGEVPTERLEARDDAIRSAILGIAKELSPALDETQARLVRNVWLQRGAAVLSTAEASDWWSAFGQSASLDLAQACWAPVLASADEVEALRLQMIAWSGEQDLARLHLPSAAQLKPDGDAFRAFRALLGGVSNHLPGEVDRLCEAFGKVLSPMLKWAQFGKTIDERLRLIKSAAVERVRLADSIKHLTGEIEQQEGSTQRQLAEVAGLQEELDKQEQLLLLLMTAPFIGRSYAAETTRVLLSGIRGLAPLPDGVLIKFLQAIRLPGGQSADEWLVSLDWKKIREQFEQPALAIAIEGSRVTLANAETVKTLWVLMKRLVRGALLLQSLGVTERSLAWVLGAHARSLGLLAPWELPSWRWAAQEEAEATGLRGDGQALSLEPEDAGAEVATAWLRLRAFARHAKLLPDIEDSANAARAVTLGSLLAAVVDSSKLLEKRPLKVDDLRAATDGLAVAATAWDLLSGNAPGTGWAVLFDGKPYERGCSFDEALVRRGLQRLKTLDNFKVLSERAAWGLQTGLDQAQVARLATVGERGVDKKQLADEVRGLLKRRFAEPDWLNAIKNGSDRLRERKRDALLDRLLGSPIPRYFAADGSARHFESRNDVLSHFLIDPQMTAGMSTSRIVQAHAAVQMFVQRCLMGLESKVRIADDQLVGWSPWEWMKHYRVWQAARKIFLYPENWIDHELRDDRSVFFKDLQDELSQGKLSERSVENAVITYLQKLNGVARLETCSAYYEFDDEKRVVHIIGRTRSDPRKYYYRRWIDEAEWTPWEPIDLEINSEQVCVFARNGRIYLAWLMASIKENEVRGEIPLPTVANKTEPTTAHWELKLALSEYANSRWSAKRVGTGILPFMEKGQRVNDLKPDLLLGLCLIFQDVANPSIAVYDRRDSAADDRTGFIGRFSLATCSADIEVAGVGGALVDSLRPLPVVERAKFSSMRFLERDAPPPDAGRVRTDTLLIKEGDGPEGTVEVLASTPGRFAVTVPQQSSLLDFLLGAVKIALADGSGASAGTTAGAWLPIFYDAQGAYRPFVERGAGDSEPVGDLMRLLGSAKALSSRPTVREASRNAADKVARLITGQVDASVVQLALGALRGAVSRDESRAPDPNVWQAKIAAAVGKNSKLVKYDGRLFHPASCDLLQVATTAGVKYLYYRDIQQEQLPGSIAEQGGKGEETYRIAYRFQDSYASYNWELFVHIPLLVARRYAAEGSYADSMRWFQAIFNVTGSDEKAGAGDAKEASGVGKYWIPRHFSKTSFEQYQAQRIGNLLDPQRWSTTESRLPEDELRELLHNLFRSVKKWRRDPANPHQVSRHRWVAYQKAVVYQFIEMLLDWGDDQFRRDSRESVNQAITLYVLAQELLGARPATVKPTAEREPKNYEQIRSEIDVADDLLAGYANAAAAAPDALDEQAANDGSGALAIYNQYFCIPQNENLVALWDRVEDRLWKIRHCRNIEGVERVLALFAPPIDPGALVRARGAGGDLDALLAGLGQPLPHYRFSVMLPRARAYAEEVRSLGNQLLQVLEKRDAEALGLIRSRQEIKMLRSMTEIRKLQTQEAQQQIDALGAMSDTVNAREKYYRSRPEVSSKEQQALDLAQAATVITTAGSLAKALSSVTSLIPEVGLGYDVGPMAYVLYGGREIASASFNFGDFLLAVGGALQGTSSIVGTQAGYERRKTDWTFQADQGALELKQLEHQLKAAKTRWQVTVAEARQLEQQIAHAEEVDEFLKSKFTNRQLFDWMLKRSTGIYARAYHLALEFARMAERCLEAELPPGETQTGLSIIQSTYWDSGAKGLLAADMLLGDLDRLDSEWLRRNRRELELTKHVSLARLDPLELLKLKVTGKCRFTIPESLYDLDFPEHARRRIKGVSLTIPCVTGPYTNVSCQLTLNHSQILLSGARPPVLDPIPVRSVCTSNARDDAGLFDFNLRDDRYLPFEGAGAHSEWSLEFPGSKQFDWTSISDAVLTMRYTAQQVGKRTVPGDGSIQRFMLSLRDEFAAEFHALVGAINVDSLKVSIAIPRETLPDGGQAEVWKLCAICEASSPPTFVVEGVRTEGHATYQDSAKMRTSTKPTKLFVWTLQAEQLKELTGRGISVQKLASASRIKDIVLLRM